jgi:hypothetical protein
MADVIPPHGDDIAVTMDLANQWLWPETRDELLAIAADLEHRLPKMESER